MTGQQVEVVLAELDLNAQRRVEVDVSAGQSVACCTTVTVGIPRILASFSTRVPL
jgi:hypothetical protein